MKRGKILAASLAVAGGMMVVGLGAGSTPASAQGYYSCPPGYYYAPGYGCYPNAPPPPVAYYPPSYYYAPPPVVVGPAFGINLDFGGGGRGGGGHGRR